MGAVAVREGYQYFTDPRCKRLGAQAWIITVIIAVEVMICVKFGKGEFHIPTPKAVVRFWQALLSFLFIFPIWQFLVRPRIWAAKVKSA